MPDLNAKPSFSQYLFYQRERVGDDGARTPREDVVGRVARWAFRDPCFPHRSKTLSHHLIHLRTHAEGAPTELELRAAHEAYNFFLMDGGMVPARIGGFPARHAEKDVHHRGYLIPRATAAQIKELAARRGTSQGEFLERLVAREFEAAS